MKIRHLNCSTIHPPCARLYDPEGKIFRRADLVCHCLLLENGDGLVLVDTGLGMRYIDRPEALGKGIFFFLNAPLDPEETAIRRITRLGYRAEDVRHIVLTHLDLDHAGGLPDFPRARVHVLAPEHDAAMNPAKRERKRYVADMWAHEVKWVRHSIAGENWFGFAKVQEILPDVFLVPLIGHTRGHCGVAVKIGGRWLMHCGDAYTDQAEVDPHNRRNPSLGSRLYRRKIPVDYEQNLKRQEELRRLARDHGGVVTFFCASNPNEFRQLSGEGYLGANESG